MISIGLSQGWLNVTHRQKALKNTSAEYVTDREEVWDNFGQADKHMVYGHASDYLEVTLEHNRPPHGRCKYETTSFCVLRVNFQHLW